MAITKRGSRPITVDGHSYRWLVRRKPSRGQSDYQASLAVAIEHSDGGSVMVVTLPQPHPENCFGQPVVPVLPADVERLIREGQAAGWRPTEPGGQFRFTSTAV